MEDSFVKLGLLSLKSRSRIKELTALKQTILESSQDPGDFDVNVGDCNNLESKLGALSKMVEQDYTHHVEAFNMQFMLENPGQTREVNQAFQEIEDAYYQLKPEVDRLIQRLRAKEKRKDVTSIVFLDSETDCNTR